MVRPIVMNYLGLPNVGDAKRTQPLIISPVSYRNECNKVFVHRELELQSAWIPVEGFKVACDFFSKISGTEQSPIVLIR